MATLPQILIDFSDACDERFGAGSAGHNDDGAFVTIDDRTVHINIDQNANRVVIWTELKRGDHVPIASVERDATQYTAHGFLARGFVVGVNRDADLVSLGCSIEQGALSKTDALDLVEEIAREGDAVAKTINARTRARASLSSNDNSFIFR